MIRHPENVMEALVQREPKKEEIILWYYDMDKLDFDACRDIYDFLEGKFPDNKIVCLPLEAQIGYFTKGYLEGLVKHLAKYLEELDHENM